MGRRRFFCVAGLGFPYPCSVVVTHKEEFEIKGFDNGGDIDCLYDNKCNGLWLEARNKARKYFHKVL